MRCPMSVARLFVSAVVASLLTVGAGCRKSDSPPRTATAPGRETVSPARPLTVTDKTPASDSVPDTDAAWAEEAKIPTDVVKAWRKAGAALRWYGKDEKLDRYTTDSDRTKV